MPQTAAQLASDTVHQRAGQRAEEARKLAEEAEGERHADLARQRQVLYTDVEELLNIGFLSHAVRVAGVRLSFRSFSPADSYLVQHRIGARATDSDWKLWTVCSAIWMVDGINLLEHPNGAVLVHRYFRGLSRGVIDILFSIMLGLFNRVSTALTRTEAYCYEEYSRASWRLCGRQSPNQDSYTGIPGSSRLGMNHVQRMWVAYNLAEDDRLTHQQWWQAAKLTASASSPRGIKKLNQSDERLRKREEDRRRKTINRMVELVLYGKSADLSNLGTMVVLVRGQPVEVPRIRMAHSPGELAEEMRRWVGGEKDFHDLIVDTYKDRLREHYGKEKQEGALEEALQPGVTGGTLLVGYTLEQLEDLGYSPPQQTTKRVFDGGAPGAVYQKWVGHDPQAGRLGVTDQTVRVMAPAEAPQRRSLQEQVEFRQLRLSTEPIDSPSVEDRAPQGGRGPGDDR